MNVFSDLFELIDLFVFLPPCGIKLFGSFLGLLLDPCEEIDEEMGICFEHILRAGQAILSHGGHLGKPLDLGLLDLEHLLNKANLSLFLDEFPPVLSILGSLNWNGEPGGLSHVHFALHLGIDSQLGRLNVCLTDAPKTAFPGGPVLLPDPQLLVLLPLDNLAVLLSFLEREYEFVGGQSKRILLVIASEH